MKFMRAGAFASSLLLFPHLGVAEDDVVWRAADPAWKTASSNDWPAGAIDNSPSAQTTAAAGGPSTVSPRDAGSQIVDWHEGQLPSAPGPQRLDVEWSSNWTKKAPSSQTGLAQTESPAPSPRDAGVSPPFTTASRQRGAEQAKQAAQKPTDDLPILPLRKPPSIDILPQQDDDEPVRAKILPPDVLPVAPAMILPPVKGAPAQASLCAPIPSQHSILPRLFGNSSSESPAHAPANSETEQNLLNVVNPTGPCLYVSADFLLWWTKSDRLPVLASTGTPESVGILGRPGTRTLFGPGSGDLGLQYGARFRGSLFFDDHSPYGVDASFMFLANNGTRFDANSNAFPVLSRPVFVLNNNQENAETVAYPNFSAGTLRIDTQSQLWGGNVNVFRRMCDTCDRTVDVFAGYRYMNLSDSVIITESIVAGPEAPDPIGTHTSVLDSFATRNVFNGGQIGAAFEQRLGAWFVNARASVAFGVNDQSLDIVGNQVQFRPGQAPTVFSGGLLAAQSNVGNYSRDRFSVIPDVALNLGYQFTPNLRAYVGYSFVYWTNVIRAGEQIDRNVDLTFIPNAPPVTPTGQRRPAVLFAESDFWAQGINFGIEWKW